MFQYSTFKIASMASSHSSTHKTKHALNCRQRLIYPLCNYYPLVKPKAKNHLHCLENTRVKHSSIGTTSRVEWAHDNLACALDIAGWDPL